MQKNRPIRKDDSDLIDYLNIWEEIAVFYNEGTITDNHLEKLFGTDLKAIHDNVLVYHYFKTEYTKEYNNLWELINKKYGTNRSVSN